HGQVRSDRHRPRRMRQAGSGGLPLPRPAAAVAAARRLHGPPLRRAQRRHGAAAGRVCARVLPAARHHGRGQHRRHPGPDRHGHPVRRGRGAADQGRGGPGGRGRWWLRRRRGGRRV
ncbi:hypothetical protein TSOC_006430, partial [Tetrabaena socialis]